MNFNFNRIIIITNNIQQTQTTNFLITKGGLGEFVFIHFILILNFILLIFLLKVISRNWRLFQFYLVRSLMMSIILVLITIF